MKRIFYVHSEMVAAHQWVHGNNPDELDEILFSVDGDDEQLVWEGSIRLMRLGQNHTAMRLEIFDDAWAAFSASPELFQILGRHNKPSGKDSALDFEAIIQELSGCGWERQRPEKPKVKPCRTCGKT